MNDALYVFLVMVALVLIIVCGVLVNQKGCKSIQLPQYQVVFYEVGGRTCYYSLDNSDGSLHVALGPTGKHCS